MREQTVPNRNTIRSMLAAVVGSALVAGTLAAAPAVIATPATPQAAAAAMVTADPMKGRSNRDRPPDEAKLVIDDNFPDPDILEVNGVYHAYATNSDGDNVQHRTSTDLRRWTVRPDAAPVLGDWVGECAFAPGGATDHCVWAPEVTAVDGGYALYYTARDEASGRQCIGVATADSPNGPFVDHRGSALVCPAEQGGAIDAGTYREGDDLYLLWKADGNCCGKPAILYLQPLSADGLELTGPPTELLRNTIPWQGAVVEAPTLIRRAGIYYLFFSANDFGGGNYRTGWATSTSLAGPYTVGRSELMTSQLFGGDVRGPGGQDVVDVGRGKLAMVFHGWDADFTHRGMYLAGLDFAADGTPFVRGAAIRYEAEDGLVRNANIVVDPTASASGKVGGLDHADSAVTLNITTDRAGLYTLGVRFANGTVDAQGRPASARHVLSVNGREVGSVSYWHTQWGNWQVVEKGVRLGRGTNTITLQRETGFAELDVVFLTAGAPAPAAAVHPEDLPGATRYEAEDGMITHAGVRQDAAASGGAVVGGLDFDDSAIELTVWSEGARRATLGIRFANGSERGGYPLEATHLLTVNDRRVATITYPHTRWGNWNVVEQQVKLRAGWNTVKLLRTAWYAEIDAVDVR